MRDGLFVKQLLRIDAGFINWSFSSDFLKPVKPRSSENPFLYPGAKTINCTGPKESSVVRFVREYRCGSVCTDYSLDSFACVINDFSLRTGEYEQCLLGISQVKRTFSRKDFFVDFETFVQI